MKHNYDMIWRKWIFISFLFISHGVLLARNMAFNLVSFNHGNN